MSASDAYQLIENQSHEFQIESQAHDGLSFIMGTCVTINLLMGSGFLALPYVFHSTGNSFSILILVAVCLIMYITCYWEGVAVCNARKYMKVYKVPEVTETLRFYCGQYVSLVYLSILSVSLWGSMWVYAILFGESLTSEVGFMYQSSVLCENGDISKNTCFIRYNVYLLILCGITTPLSLLELKEQAWFQYFMTMLRVVLIIVMCFTVLYAYGNNSMEYSFPYTYMKDREALVSVQSSDFQSWHAIFSCISSCVFALYLNSSIPIVAQGLQKKSDLNGVILTALITTIVLYGTLGVIVSFCFDEYVDNPTNLNWTGYRWPAHNDDSSEDGSKPPSVFDISHMSAKAIELLVLLFPAIDVLSVYPLTSRILSNNMIETIWGVEPTDIRAMSSHFEFVLRCLMNVLPIAFASIMPNFVYIVDYVGGISVSICLVFPALLCICGNSYLHTRNRLLQYDKDDHFVEKQNAVEGGDISMTGVSYQNQGSDHLLSAREEEDGADTSIVVDRNEVQIKTILDHHFVSYGVLCMGCVLTVLIITDTTRTR